MNEWKMRGKEASPEQTVQKIKGILAACGLTGTVQEMPRDLHDCYSCRLTLDGPTGGLMGTNGKGMTLELSHASAYGEMMERLENRMFMAMPRDDDEAAEDFLLKDAPLYDLDDEEQEEVVTKLRKRIADTITSGSIFMSKDEITTNLLRKIAPKKLNGKFGTTPYFSLRKQKWVYLPSWIAIFTGSNGYAAGNTTAEAMVEAISELLERFSQMQVLDGKIIPPQIPRDYLEKYPHILKVIDEIEASGRYRVRVLDCSLEQKLPVVAGMIIDTQTGRFGVKFGAQPNMAVALERVFTESMQGNRLESFANGSDPFYTLPEGTLRADKWNSMKISASNMPAQLLMDNASYAFKPWGDVQGRSNTELMWEMLHLMEDLGADIYVRDASYLGFPAISVYASGISEVIPVDALELKIHILDGKVQDYFRRIDTLTDAEVKDMSVYASIKRGAVLENRISGMSHLYFRDEMPGTPFEADILLAACQYRLGQDQEALQTISPLLGMSKYLSPEQLRFIRGTYFYLQGLSAGQPEQNAFDVIKNLCGREADRVREAFSDRRQVLAKLYPVCQNKPAVEITEGGCVYGAVHDFYKMLVDAENAHPADRKTLETLLKR